MRASLLIRGMIWASKVFNNNDLTHHKATSNKIQDEVVLEVDISNNNSKAVSGAATTIKEIRQINSSLNPKDLISLNRNKINPTANQVSSISIQIKR